MLYGMYSEKYPDNPTLARHQVVVNNQPITNLNIHFREKMFLQTVAENYLLQVRNNGIDPLQTRVESHYPFFTQASFYPFVSKKIYNEPDRLPQFETWYTNKVASVTGQPVQRISIVRQTFQVLPYSVPVKMIHVDTLQQF